MAEFTGRERVAIAAGLCGWELRTTESLDEDLLWHSDHRWIRVRYDKMSRIIEAHSHAQVGHNGPSIEEQLSPGHDRAEQVIGWLSLLR